MTGGHWPLPCIRQSSHGHPLRLPKSAHKSLLPTSHYTWVNYLVQAPLRWTGIRPRSVLLAKAHNFRQVEALRCSQYIEEVEEAGQPACPDALLW